MATSDDLMDLAKAAADRIDLPDERVRWYPSFSDVEEQCATEYDQLLEALHEDELFQAVDVQHQEDLVERLKALLGEAHEEMLDDLVDNETRHLWLHQEAAFHLGMAIGLRLAHGRKQ